MHQSVFPKITFENGRLSISLRTGDKSLSNSESTITPASLVAAFTLSLSLLFWMARLNLFPNGMLLLLLLRCVKISTVGFQQQLFTLSKTCQFRPELGSVWLTNGTSTSFWTKIWYELCLTVVTNESDVSGKAKTSFLMERNFPFLQWQNSTKRSSLFPGQTDELKKCLKRVEIIKGENSRDGRKSRTWCWHTQTVYLTGPWKIILNYE